MSTQAGTSKLARAAKVWTLPAHAASVALLLAAQACNTHDTSPTGQSTTTAVASEVSTSIAVTQTPKEAERQKRQDAFESAKHAIEAAEREPAEPGAPQFELKRAAMVARAKSEPVFFIRAPRQSPEVSIEAKALRDHLVATDYAWRTVRELRPLIKRRPALARDVLLPEGYLYSEEPNLAFTLVSQIRPTDLFDSPQLWIERGSNLMRAVRDNKDGYVYQDGPERGNRVRLLHLDRLSADKPTTLPLHRDFRALRSELFFEQARVRHVTATQIVVDLRYGTHWVPTLLSSQGASLTRVVEAVEPAIDDELAAVRSRLERTARAVSVLRNAMRDMIDEALPFDEPKTEVGQEDGKLRAEWVRAYLSGRTTYKYNDDTYPVFDPQGRARVPQVCIDFMVDTFDRASGTWWRPKADKRREKTTGRLDMSQFSRSQLRQTAYFVKLARERSDMFDVRDFDEKERIELGYKDTFFAWLQRNVDAFEAGDIILIRGLTPWDEVDEHTHSFFIYETDPITGVPIAIAGNAGPANLWSWETEARRTPHRTVRTRIRPKLEWLETFIDTQSKTRLVPPALISGRR